VDNKQHGGELGHDEKNDSKKEWSDDQDPIRSQIKISKSSKKTNKKQLKPKKSNTYPRIIKASYVLTGKTEELVRVSENEAGQSKSKLPPRPRKLE
jgi:hypothetical protein